MEKAISTNLYRKVIRITAEQSPNVRLALEEIRSGIPVSHERIVPGVITYRQYLQRRQTWDEVRQTIGLDGLFYEGAELLLFPPAWRRRAEQMAAQLRGADRRAKAIGVDTAEGGDSTSKCAVDELGIIELVSMKTPDTSIIPGDVVAFATKHGVPAEMVCFDRGGGGKQHADKLRRQGFHCTTVSFGAKMTPPPRRHRTAFSERQELFETTDVYVNKRAQMFGRLSALLDPGLNPDGWGIPEEYSRLHTELAPIPKLYDEHGRLYLPPKSAKTKTSGQATLISLIGWSPDEADATVIAVDRMMQKAGKPKAGAV